MRVLVVARTRMAGDRVCVGAIDLGTGQSLRLKRPDGTNAKESHPIRPGTIWDLTYEPDGSVQPPHVEDVIVSGGHWVEDVVEMKAAILDVWRPWECGLDGIFEGKLDTTYHGTGFLHDQPDLPSGSTGFWFSSTQATIDPPSTYRFEGGTQIRRVTYKGMIPPIQTIPVGALLRFSLARWNAFPPEMTEERCYLQLSAFYL